jgi:hypothetical protein
MKKHLEKIFPEANIEAVVSLYEAVSALLDACSAIVAVFTVFGYRIVAVRPACSAARRKQIRIKQDTNAKVLQIRK